jgi:hypothetical protein
LQFLSLLLKPGEAGHQVSVRSGGGSGRDRGSGSGRIGGGRGALHLGSSRALLGGGGLGGTPRRLLLHCRCHWGSGTLLWGVVGGASTAAHPHDVGMQALKQAENIAVLGQGRADSDSAAGCGDGADQTVDTNSLDHLQSDYKKTKKTAK